MHRVLFYIAGQPFFTYNVTSALAMFGAMAVIRAEAGRRGWNKSAISWLTVRSTLIGFFWSHVTYAITRLDLLFSSADQGKRFLSVLINFGSGFVWYGGFLGAWHYTHWWAKKNGIKLMRMYDSASLAIIVAQGMGRFGCILDGCCYGSPTSLPWGYIVPTREFPPGTLLHPSPAYEALYLAGLFLVLWKRRKHVRYDGEIFVLYLIFAPLGRFLVEFTRGDTVRGFVFGWISTSQFLALVMIAVAFGFRTRLRKASGV